MALKYQTVSGELEGRKYRLKEKEGLKPLQNITQRRATRNAKIQDEEQKYRLGQFFAILLKADKARLLSSHKKEGSDHDQGGKET